MNVKSIEVLNDVYHEFSALFLIDFAFTMAKEIYLLPLESFTSFFGWIPEFNSFCQTFFSLPCLPLKHFLNSKHFYSS